MIWLLGAEGVFVALFGITGWTIFDSLSKQFEHSSWHGFTFYDLIFPLFIFLSGVTLGLSKFSLIGATYSSKKQAYKKALKRVLILFFLGIIYNHGWGQGIPADTDSIRYASVLFRIAVSWFFCAVIVWHFSVSNQALIGILILLVYWLFQQFIAVPNGVAGSFTIDGSWNAWIDQTLLPGITYRNAATDPEGLFSQLPAIVNALAGAFAGRLIVNQKIASFHRVGWLVFASLMFLFVGWCWSFILPINKTLWTSSFALISIGFSGLLLAVFYLLFDVFKFRLSGTFFAVIGANSILLYVLTSLFNWQYLTNSLFGNLVSNFEPFSQLLVSLILLVSLQWLFAFVLYKNKLFVRV